MNSASASARLGAANPAPVGPEPDPGLFAAIVAEPGDPELGSGARPRRGRGRLRPMSVRIAIAAAVLALGSASAWAAIDGSSPLALWQRSPEYGSGPSQPWPLQPIPGSMHVAASVAIPGEGEAQLWFARGARGSVCSALRLPDGTWSAAGEGSPLDLGGAVPECHPTRRQVNAAAGAQPVYVIDGIEYEEGLIAAADGGSGAWRVYYGRVDPGLGAVRVVERTAGKSAPVAPGGEFALAVRDPEPPELHTDLVAVDAAGTVVAGE